ncbi:nucleoside deaminase [Bdellovibrio sp. NC01]|uniref:nucleoside deaminase n=1 Tax=Bdellovibrio sp. NC01 TaxID=2220073 RepID=UPI0011598963|nr:nucleoside deaminase [Bdellovibrio sp. NC01]QDK37313.1 nucleoside deaminase [Bdellovibrio sp. NC01]
MSEKDFLKQAVELAIENRKKGGRPFGALLVKDGQIIAKGVNNILTTFDPSSHAEMEAIRSATMSTRNLDLRGCTIYASGQPCPMCLAAMAFTGVSEAVFAFANADAEPFGFSSAVVYSKLHISEVEFIPFRKVDCGYSASQVYG